jgi:hypothetical protein
MFKLSDLEIVCDPAIPENSLAMIQLRSKTSIGEIQALAGDVEQMMRSYAEMEAALIMAQSVPTSWRVAWRPIEPTCCVYRKLTGFNDHKCAGRAPNPYPMPKDYVKS